MSVLLRLSLERAQQVETEVALWRPVDSKEAEAVRVLDEFIRQNIEVGELLDRTWAGLRDELFGGRVDDVVGLGNLIDRAMQVTDRLFEHLEKQIESAKKRGFVLERHADWQIERDKSRKVRQQFESEWPCFDPDVTDAALANIKAGNVRAAEDVLTEAKGLS